MDGNSSSRTPLPGGDEAVDGTATEIGGIRRQIQTMIHHLLRILPELIERAQKTGNLTAPANLFTLSEDAVRSR